MINTIFFDVYGTLISTGTGSVDATREILKKAGSELDPAAFYEEWKTVDRKLQEESAFRPEARIFALGLAQMYDKHGIRSDAFEDIEIMMRTLYGRDAFPEVESALRELHKKYRIVIASNTDTRPLMYNMERNGLVVHTDGIFTSESLQCYKPDREFYQRILDATGAKAQETVYIGDSPREDVWGPQQVGLKAILIDRRHRYSPGGIVPDSILDSIPSELPF